MGKGGSDASQSGMMEAMASAQAAERAYQLGEEQLQWAKDVWNKEQPLMDASTQQQMDLSKQEQAALQQMSDESRQQWDEYQKTYLPLEQQFVGQVKDWASPAQQALSRGQAMGSVAEQGQTALNTAAETLRGYGINPGSGRYAGLYAGAQPMLGAAEAAAGTNAGEQLKLQQMGLEGAAINTGRGMVNTTGSLTQAGSGAGQVGSGSASGAARTSTDSLTAGSQAMSAPTAWFNSGAANMGTYVNAVNGYNTAQADSAAADSASLGGIGSAIGGIAGMLLKYDAGGNVGPSDPQYTPDQGGGQTGIPSAPLMPAQAPPGATPGGTVPTHASPSGGVATDDVPAMLTANEFVIPKDVAMWKGHEYFAKQIDQARKGQQQFAQRDDVGGEPVPGIPQQPTFISRPQHMGMTGIPPRVG